MNETPEIENAKDMAIGALITAAAKVNESLGSFSGWLLVGIGAAFSVLLANFEAVSRFVHARNIGCALLLLVLSLIVSVIARLMSAMVSSALGSHEQVKRLIDENSGPFDLDAFATEFERGLFPHQRWVARRSMAKAQSGDRVAAARFISKLSQVQALLVLGDAALAIGAATVLVAGLRAA